MTHSELEQALKPRLTPEFLETLVEAARVVGWGVDLIEVLSFIDACHGIAGQPAPPKGSIEPYETED